MNAATNLIRSNIISPYHSDHLKTKISKNLLRDIDRAKHLAKVCITQREMNDCIMLGIGAFTPLSGPMNHADWKSVCTNMKLSNGTLWPIPISISIDEETARMIKEGDDIALVNDADETIAILAVSEIYLADKTFECEHVYKTCDPSHPGVKDTLALGPYNLAGDITVLSEGNFKKNFPTAYKTPQETRHYFTENGWDTIVAFQTRNPLHRSHEHLLKIILEQFDGVFIHSLLGGVKEGDFDATVRVKAIDMLLHHYFPTDRSYHCGYPLTMRYAGPREAVLHAIFRQNFGCTHIIIGRDHAGVGNFYKPFDAQEIFQTITDPALKIQPIFMQEAYWCHLCESMATLHTCPHPSEHHESVSGTRLRAMLNDGSPIPSYISRPEVVHILREYV